MTIDYKELAKLVDIRQKQISDCSLELEFYNKEYNELNKIRKSLTELILLERKNWKDFEVSQPQEKV
jgi:hypothetical protein